MPVDLIGKADRAARSARILFDSGDMEGAINRAYYAMFDAARAAIVCVDTGSADSRPIKTHKGLLSAFSLLLVKTGRLPVALGQDLNRVGELRQIADYTGREITPAKAHWAIETAESFVQKITQEFDLCA